MREFVGKAAFVTGGASGIGLALGRAFAEAGCKIMLADIEKPALASFSGSGREIRGVICDVADPASVDAAAEATFSALGNVHILCNNAGVGARGGIDHIALDNWRWVLDVNLIGVVNGVRAFVPHMRAHGEGGHIINTASIAGMINRFHGFHPYPATRPSKASRLDRHGDRRPRCRSI
jgi:NAD(P)-dependent dehydrogenase (short-subunit alcohol dehydrogenase family)